jgi:hypothetical protein
MVRKYAENKRAAKIAIGKLAAATEAQRRTEVTNQPRKVRNRLLNRSDVFV